MKVTLDHPESRYGIPVILNPDGSLADLGEGMKAILREAGVSATEFAKLCNVEAQTVYNWRGGQYKPSAAALNVLGKLLDDHKISKGKPQNNKSNTRQKP